MIILDSYAVLALLRDEPAAESVQELLSGPRRATLTVVGVAEVADRLVRLSGADEDEVALDLAQLGFDSTPLTADQGLRAGLLRARHYHRRTRAVSLADCVAAEAARAATCPLATSDPHLLDLCHDDGIGVVVLPDSSGVIWKPG